MLRFLLGLTQLRRMEPSSWSLAVAVLDLYLSRLSTSVVDQLPAVQLVFTLVDLFVDCVRSIAILRMVGKFDGKVAESDRSSWVPLAQHMQQCLQGLGLGRGLEVTERSLCEQEITILQTLDWQLDLPFFEQWITVYCSRLGVFSDASKDRVTWVEHRCICFSRLLTFREAACADAAPRLLSLGLVCLALVWGHLLPWQQLCPDDRNNWQSRFQQICTAIGANATPASFNDSHVPDTSKMVKALKQSTASDWASLQSATSLVMDKLILALNELPELARAYHQV